MIDRRSIISAAAVAGLLVLVGAGCGAVTTSIPADQMNRESALTQPMGSVSEAQQAAEAAEQRTMQDNNKDQAPVSGAGNEEAGTGAAAPEKWERPTKFPGILPDAELKNKVAEIVLDKGKIVFDILASEAPKAASNFIVLARSGYYDGIVFHRVVPGFVIQGGDPAGNGTGGPGYQFEDETARLNYDAGIVAMANAGPDTNGSQFFIVLENQPSLPKNYTIFGRVISGLDIVRQVAVGDVMRSVTIRDKR